MRPFELIDPLYDDFVRSLSGSLAESARALAVTLRLAPERGIPWSLVFSHEVTLGAPALLADGFTGVARPTVEAAVSAHMLAVIEAFGTDRISDRQVPESPALVALLAAMRDARDAALARACGGRQRAVSAYADADRTTRQAIAREAALLSAAKPVTFEEYESVSLGKQAVGFPASVALAQDVNADARTQEALVEILTGVWLGLQMADDVNDWEDDAARIGAWAVVLAGADPSAPRSALTHAVFESGVLPTMLARAKHYFRSAERGACSLGATRLSRWAGERATEIDALIDGEQASPGYVGRRRSLGAWAAEVLA